MSRSTSFQHAIELIDPAHFEEKLKEKMSHDLYNDLEDEFALVALKMPAVAHLIRERKL